MNSFLYLKGSVIEREARAEAVIAFIEATITDLEDRTGDISVPERKQAYIGDVG